MSLDRGAESARARRPACAEAQRTPDQMAERKVRRSRLEGLAEGPHDLRPTGARLQLLEQARFADAGRPDDVDQSAPASPSSVQPIDEGRQLPVPASERQVPGGAPSLTSGG